MTYPFDGGENMSDTGNAGVNGFTLRNVRKAPSPDGYAISATLYFRDRKVGAYRDTGDGGDYNFYPAKGFTRSKVEEALESFPKIPSPFEGVPPLSWNIGILVEEIINRNEMLGMLMRAKAEGKILAEAASHSLGLSLTAALSSLNSDSEAEERMRYYMSKKFPRVKDFKVNVYRNEEDIDVNDTEVVL